MRILEALIRDASSRVGRWVENLWEAHAYSISHGYDQALHQWQRVTAEIQSHTGQRDMALFEMQVAYVAFDAWRATGEDRYLAEGIEATQRALGRFEELRDEHNAASCNEYLGYAALQRERFREAWQIFRRQVGILSRRPGLGNDKGSIYGNLFITALLLKRVQLAEGYFNESNLNFVAAANVRGLSDNFANLLKYISREAERKGSTSLPSGLAVYEVLLGIVVRSGDEGAKSNLVGGGVEYFRSSVRRGDLGSASYVFRTLLKTIGSQGDLTLWLELVESGLRRWGAEAIGPAFFPSDDVQEPETLLRCYMSWRIDSGQEMHSLLRAHGLPSEAAEALAAMFRRAASQV